MSFPTFPNWRMILSCSGGPGCDGVGAPAPGCIAAINWKFLTDATVTRPRKFRHQHCSCSCHLGGLFFSTKGLIFPSSSPSNAARPISENLALLNSMEWSKAFENDALRNESSREFGGRSSGRPGTTPPASREDTGIECIIQCILRGPRVPKTFSS